MLIVLVLTIVIIVLYLLFKRPIQKQIFGVDAQFRNFLYKDFDSPAMLPEDTGKTMYTKSGKKYLKNSARENMNVEFMIMLDRIDTNLTDIDLYKRINSGYRTQHYNDSLQGSKKNSAHIGGLAVDISTRGLTEDQFNRLIKALKDEGVKRIGYYDTYIHVDIDSTKPQVEWYRKAA